jgi:glycosyltransferase involved in cell wall biosynthesis
MVSIIIPTFNRETLVVETLNSVINQTSSDWECIIVDDGSIDNTIDIISEFCKEDDRFKILKRNREPKGAATCRNIGWQNSKYEYIVFLDSDDLIAPWCIKERLAYMRENSELDFGLFPAIEFKNTKSILKYRSLVDVNNPILSFLSFEATWQTSCPIWRKSFLKKINGWNESSVAWQDGEVHIRALLNTNKFKWATQIPDIFIRLDSQNTITSVKSANKYINIINTYEYIFNIINDIDIKNYFKHSVNIWLFNIVEHIKDKELDLFIYFLSSKELNIVSSKNIIKLKYYSKTYSVFNKISGFRFVFYQIREMPIFFPKRKQFYRNKPEVSKNILDIIKKKLSNSYMLNKLYLS